MNAKVMETIEGTVGPSGRNLRDDPPVDRSMPASAAASLDGVIIGKLIGFNAAGMALVELRVDESATHLAARRCIALEMKDVGAEVLVMFECGDLLKPIIVGRIRADIVSVPVSGSPSESTGSHDVVVDGNQIELVAAHSVRFRCGDASVTLTRDGKVVIRGVHVVTHASGVNRIRGGSVQIN